MYSPNDYTHQQSVASWLFKGSSLAVEAVRGGGGGERKRGRVRGGGA